MSVIIKAKAVCVIYNVYLVNTATKVSIRHLRQSRCAPSCCFAVVIQVIVVKVVIFSIARARINGVPSVNRNVVQIMIFWVVCGF